MSDKISILDSGRMTQDSQFSLTVNGRNVVVRESINLDVQNIAYLYPELANQIKERGSICKFRDCLHITEPGCQINKDFERYKFYKELVMDFKTHHSRNQVD